MYVGRALRLAPHKAIGEHLLTSTSSLVRGGEHQQKGYIAVESREQQLLPAV
jgi:hypothetical protein